MTVPFKASLKKVCKETGTSILEFGHVKSSKSTVFKCFCGEVFTQSASSVIRKGFAGCPSCCKDKMRENQSKAKLGKSPPNKKDKDYFVKKIESSGMSLVAFDKRRPKVKCNKCNTTSLRYMTNILRYGCLVCKGLRKTTESYNIELEELDVPFTCLNYSGARSKSDHVCNSCDHVVRVSPTNALKKGKLRCPKCETSGFYVIKYRRNTFTVRGYERFVIKDLLRKYGVKGVLTDIGGSVPRIKLGSKKFHRPDFYIPEDNLCIEIKSLNTAGLSGINFFNISQIKLFNLIKKKYRKAIDQGFKYELKVISDKGEEIKLPKNWHSLNRSEVLKYL